MLIAMQSLFPSGTPTGQGRRWRLAFSSVPGVEGGVTARTSARYYRRAARSRAQVHVLVPKTVSSHSSPPEEPLDGDIQSCSDRFGGEK